VVRSSRRLVEAALVLALAGCGEDLRIDVRYRVIGRPPVTAGSCPTASAPPTAAGATKVRFTFRDRPGPGGAPGALRCDVVVARTAVDPVIAVPRKDEPVDLWVEYFDDAGALIARGSKTAVTLTGGDDVTIYAGAAAGYGCAPTQTTAPRAFHSATLLPTGEVLLFGGLTGGAGAAASADLAPAAGAYVTASAEIYDPCEPAGVPADPRHRPARVPSGDRARDRADRADRARGPAAGSASTAIRPRPATSPRSEARPARRRGAR
jgi:hypothetical protein